MIPGTEPKSAGKAEQWGLRRVERNEMSVDEQIQTVIDDPRHVPISKNEQHVIWQAIRYGRAYGFGNMMGWLATAWAIDLRAQGLPEETAIEAASGGTPYPLPKLPVKKGKHGKK